jgi:hypothetical protein
MTPKPTNRDLARLRDQRIKQAEADVLAKARAYILERRIASGSTAARQLQQAKTDVMLAIWALGDAEAS